MFIEHLLHAKSQGPQQRGRTPASLSWGAGVLAVGTDDKRWHSASGGAGRVLSSGTNKTGKGEQANGDKFTCTGLADMLHRGIGMAIQG